MIEIQCTSCHTRYRIDERVLPDDTPTFKCSRCGHVFNADPLPARTRKPAPPAAESESQPRTIRPARPRPSALKSQVGSDVVKREPVAELRPTTPPEPASPAQPSDPGMRAQVERTVPAALPDEPKDRDLEERNEPDDDDPLNRTFGDREQKADTGENLRFDFSDAPKEISAPPDEEDFERPEADDAGWQVGEPPSEFESARTRRAPTMMDEPEAAPRPAPAPVRRMAAPLQAEAPRFAPAPATPAGFQMGQAVDDGAHAAAPGSTHASGFFLALFFFVAVAFLGASALICDEPAASMQALSQAPRIGEYFARPIVPAMLVALHDVRSEYYALKGGHVALVISGNAENVGPHALHLVEIDADLLGVGAHPIASQIVYCGNELSPTMLGEMTPREIEFSQGLSPQKGFALEPSSSAPFLMVFIDPPTGANNIRIAVSKADTIASAPDSGATSAPPG